MIALFFRDIRLAIRAGGGFGLALAFFLTLVVMIPLSVGADPEMLARIAPGTLWLGVLLSCLLSLDRLLVNDWEDGSLDLLATAPLPLEALIIAKAAAHWVTTALPMIIAAPLFAILLNLPLEGLPALLLGLVLGSPALSVIGIFGAALTVQLKRGGLLLSLLVLPLYFPTLILGTEAARRGALSIEIETPLLLLAALSMACLGLLPFASAALLRMSLR